MEYNRFLTRLIYLDIIFVIYKLHKNHSNNIVSVVLSYDFIINYMISILSLYSIYNYNIKLLLLTVISSIIIICPVLYVTIVLMINYCSLYYNNYINTSILEFISNVINCLIIIVLYLYIFLIYYNFINGIYNLSNEEYSFLINF